MAKIVERYKSKVEESYNTCGVLQVKNLQKIKKASPDNPANLTMFYYCGRNLGEMKEVDNTLTNNFDESLKTALWVDFPLPMLATHYKVKLSIDGGEFSKEEVWAYPLASSIAFFRSHETATDTINDNSGFLYS